MKNMINKYTSENKGRAGAPRITQHLRDEGQTVGKNRVARVMHIEQLRAKAARKYKATTHSKHNLPVAPNRLEQDFTSDVPNQKWVSDITCVWTDEGWLYLARIGRMVHRRIHCDFLSA
jgi:transposase InsO family protein